MADLKINSITVSWPASDTLEQSYSTVGGISTRRTQTGQAVKQVAWTKVATTLSGSGIIPPALQTVDWDSPVTVSCVAPLSVKTTGISATLPSARRSDIAPWAFAILTDGAAYPVSVSMAGDVATVAAKSGAVAYEVNYLPELTVYSDGPNIRYDARGAAYSWEISAEEA